MAVTLACRARCQSDSRESANVFPPPRSGETTLATGFNPWTKLSRVPPAPEGRHNLTSCAAAPRLVTLAEFLIHGLKPVARVVSPLRGGRETETIVPIAKSLRE